MGWWLKWYPASYILGIFSKGNTPGFLGECLGGWPLLLGWGRFIPRVFTSENSHFEPFKMEVWWFLGDFPFQLGDFWVNLSPFIFRCVLGGVSGIYQTGSFFRVLFSEFSPRHNVRCWIATLPWPCLATQGAVKIVGFQRDFLSMVGGPKSYSRLNSYLGQHPCTCWWFVGQRLSEIHPPKTNECPLQRRHFKRKVVFQRIIFQGTC